MPFTPVFGDGSTKFQPVFVKDLAQAVAHCAETSEFEGKIVEIGGPKGIFTNEKNNTKYTHLRN